MLNMTNVAAAAAAVAWVAFASSTVHGATIYVKNRCDKQVDLWDNSRLEPVQPGGATERHFGDGYHGMLRHGMNPQATLAEFSISNGKPWYDISIIPAGGPGPGFCPNLNACKQTTGGTGFNLPLQIKPTSNLGRDTCQVLTCEYDGCPDAYLYPKDDQKTHNCPAGTDFEVIFCPSGNGGATQPPHPAPAPPSSSEPSTTAPPPAPAPAPVPATATGAATTQPADQPLGQAQVDVVNVSAHNDSTSPADAKNSSSSSHSRAGSSNDQLGNATALPTPPAATTVTPPAIVTLQPSSKPVQKVTTKSSHGSGTVLGVLLIGAALCAIGTALVFVVLVRRKKQKLDLEAKSPMLNIDDDDEDDDNNHESDYCRTETPRTVAERNPPISL